MELKNFITGVLEEVTGAVDEFNGKKHYCYIYGKETGDSIDFDVAVAISQENETGKKGGISVALSSVLNLGGSGEKKEKSKNQNTHRLKFGIQIERKN